MQKQRRSSHGSESTIKKHQNFGNEKRRRTEVENESPLKENLAPKKISLRPRKALLSELNHANAELNEMSDERDSLVLSFEGLRNKSIRQIPVYLRDELSARMNRLKNVDISAPNNEGSQEMDVIIPKVIRRIRQAINDLERNEQTHKQIEKAKQNELELEENVSRKMALLEVIADGRK